MKSININIPAVDAKNELKIIYKEIFGGLHEVRVQRGEFERSLRYFGRRSKEIDSMNAVYIEENISIDIFRKFINSIESKEITICEEDIECYKYLSQKYEYTELSMRIDEFTKNRPDVVETLESLTKKNESGNELEEQEKEEIISKHLDIALRSGILNKVPLSAVNRILNSPKRVLKDHHLLHAFVIETIKRHSMKHKKTEQEKEEDDENILILPSSLDYAEMTNDELEELFEVESGKAYFNPRNASTRIQQFLKDSKTLSERMNKLEEQLDKVSRNEEELKNKTCILENQLNEMKKNEEECKIKTRMLESKVSEHILPKITQLQKQEEKLSTEQTTIEERISTLEAQIQTQTDNILKKIETKMNENLQTEEINKMKIAFVNIEKSFHKLKTIISNNQEQCTQLTIINKKLLQEQETHKLSPLNKVIECEQGIFKYLFDKYKTNPINIGIIEIKGNSNNFDNHRLLRKLIDSKSSETSWCSQRVKNSYIKIDFINSLVKIKKYRLDIGGENGKSFFTSWVLRGITDDYRDIILDNVKNSNEITQNNHVIIRSIENEDESYVRSIQLIMGQKNSDDNYCMIMKNIEIYGTLKTSE